MRDVDCAFKLVRGDALRALALASDGAMICTELLVRAALAGLRGSPSSACTTGRAPRASRAAATRASSPRAFRERRALLRARCATPTRADRAAAGARAPTCA